MDEELKILQNEFPLRDVNSCVRFVRKYLEISIEPNLSLCSILLGVLESVLTRPVSVSAETLSDNGLFPIIELSTVNALVLRFQTLIRGSVDLSNANLTTDRLSVVKRVSDVIWNYLSKSYRKDRAHLQSLFSFLTGRMLDAFGVAMATVAGCQVLGLADVHLAIAEDHVWLVLNSGEAMEVTWHGKAIEDRRKLAVNKYDGSWLYLGGHAVVCSRHMELAALVTGMNPVIMGSTDSFELTLIQKELLWLLYEKGHLNKYPMALATLSDLEQLVPSSLTPDSRVGVLVLYEQAIEVARRVYNNSHVYPYLYLAQYHYRHFQYKDALANWARAACVISRYNYAKDDEEMYKDLKEVADLLPSLFRPPAGREDSVLSVDDAECYAMLLRFIDGLCKWEEGSCLPVLHEGWATNFVNVMSKFTPTARSRVTIVHREGSEDDSSRDSDSSEENNDEDAADRKKAKIENADDSQMKQNNAFCSSSLKNDDAFGSTTKDGSVLSAYSGNCGGQTVHDDDRTTTDSVTAGNSTDAAIVDLVSQPATTAYATCTPCEGGSIKQEHSSCALELSNSQCETASSTATAHSQMDMDTTVLRTATVQPELLDTASCLKDSVGSPTGKSPCSVSLGLVTRRAQRRSVSNEYYGGTKISNLYGLNDMSLSLKRFSPTDASLEESKIRSDSTNTCSEDVRKKDATEIEGDAKNSMDTASVTTQQTDGKKRTRRSRAYDSFKDTTSSVDLSAKKVPGSENVADEEPGCVQITFKSEKMYGLRHIVVNSADKLNTMAVKLLLTAQSHVHLRNSTGPISEKRTRTQSK